MKRTLSLPVATAVLAVTGFLLRRWHLATAWEGGFVLPTAPANLALWAFLAVSAAVLLFLARGCKGTFTGYLSAFQSPMKLWAVLAALSGALTAVGGLLWLVERRSAGWLEVALGVSFILAGGAISYLGRVNQRRTERRELLISLVPGYAGCLWLVEVYQRNTAHPELMEYLFYLLGVAAAILALYTMAGFSFEKTPRPKCFCRYAALAVVLLFTDLADRRDWPTVLVEAGIAIFLYVQMTALLFRESFPAELDQPPKAETPQEGENTQENGGVQQ